MMNEGCATFVHYEIMNTLYERGLITEGSMLEVLHLHSSVVMQPGFDDQRYGGINPYALGFAMMRDIKRICEEPTDEDRDWFPDFAGNGDAIGTLKDAWADYRDESFILQFLSPTVIRDMRFFALHDEFDEPEVEVTAIHNEMGYRDVRRRLARFYDASIQDPDIRITDADLSGTRRLTLTHTVRDGRLLSKQECDRTLAASGPALGTSGEAARGRRRHRQDAARAGSPAAALSAGGHSSDSRRRREAPLCRPGPLASPELRSRYGCDLGSRDHCERLIRHPRWRFGE